MKEEENERSERECVPGHTRSSRSGREHEKSQLNEHQTHRGFNKHWLQFTLPRLQSVFKKYRMMNALN
jgi:hypothetical protein